MNQQTMTAEALPLEQVPTFKDLQVLIGELANTATAHEHKVHARKITAAPPRTLRHLRTVLRASGPYGVLVISTVSYTAAGEGHQNTHGTLIKYCGAGENDFLVIAPPSDINECSLCVVDLDAIVHGAAVVGDIDDSAPRPYGAETSDWIMQAGEILHRHMAETICELRATVVDDIPKWYVRFMSDTPAVYLDQDPGGWAGHSVYWHANRAIREQGGITPGELWATMNRTNPATCNTLHATALDLEQLETQLSALPNESQVVAMHYDTDRQLGVAVLVQRTALGLLYNTLELAAPRNTYNDIYVRLCDMDCPGGRLVSYLVDAIKQLRTVTQ